MRSTFLSSTPLSRVRSAAAPSTSSVTRPVSCGRHAGSSNPAGVSPSWASCAQARRAAVGSSAYSPQAASGSSTLTSYRASSTTRASSQTRPRRTVPSSSRGLPDGVDATAAPYKASTVSGAGSAPWAPASVTAAAPARTAYATASSRGTSVASFAARAPTNASPAPVVSTTFTFGAVRCCADSPPENTAPSSPSVTTTDLGPKDRSLGAASSASSTPSTLSPRRKAASCSLITRGSSFSSSARGTSNGGAKLTSARVPFPAATSTARRTTSSGTSIWATSTRASPMDPEASSTSSAVRRRFAPGATVIAFSPSGVTVMKAAPVDEPGTSFTRVVSTPLSASDLTSGPPKPSSPTRPRKATLAPRRAAAAAWLAPLPPLWVARRASVTVSPGAGRRSTLRTKSWFIEPTTKTSATLSLLSRLLSLAQELWDFGVDHHLEQVRSPGAHGALDCGEQIPMLLYKLAIDAESPRNPDEVYAFNVESRYPVPRTNSVAETLEDGVTAVVDNDKGDFGPVAGRAPERLD